MHAAPLALAALLVAPLAFAKVQTREITYRQGDTELQGFVAWDDSWGGKRPGVLIVHEWWGHNQHARNQAMRAASEGYVGFALDMFGKGKVTTHPQDAQAFAGEIRGDLPLMKARFDAGLQAMKSDEHVDPERVAAFGYCFGGAVALEMARAGADLDAVVTFHGSIATENPAKPGAVRPRILVLNGADDPMVTADALAAFDAEMKAAGASFEVVNLPGAKHAFTNPDADAVGMPQLAYDAKADRKSWKRAMALLREVFGK